ncbi:hypothetical protein [Mucilaginibacter ginkgonis]|uniref:Uncharacterized protein n=1 Tax=Mucilaginibacter ginkgonis TaxID=2682091 RepID=A0A6I4HZW7_9SPHI|nr:hypothetical protein [Mucilaginibacter ginkgonis]QQL48764.1 hypothetical protein GO620_011305 [Mucilaginibacter ginkgonis]
MSEKMSLYVVIALQIMFVLPFPALLFYFINKPKYIVPLFVAAAVFQLLPAALNSRNKPIVFFCLCGSMLMLLEAAMYMIFTTV